MRAKRWTRIVLVAGLALLICGQGERDAHAQSLGRLRARLRQTLTRRRQVEQELRNVKAEQATVSHRLSAVQRELEAARGRLRAARRKLNEIESDLRQVKADKQRTEEQLSGHSEAMSARLLAMYREGTPSYLEVVLNATDFQDFATRADNTRLFAKADQELLSQLVGAKQELVAQKAIIEDYRQDQTELTRQIQYQTAQVEKRKREAEALVARTNRNRQLLEAEWTAHEQAGKEIQAYIRRLQAGGGRSGVRYTGSCAGQFLMPVRGRLTSPYGYRIHPILHVRKFHTGIDIAAPTGTAIKAAEKGLVVHSDWWGALGKCVIVDHGSGWSTYYGHCSSLLVSKGDYVARGDIIGRVGSTGRSTGPHLHWTVMHNGNTVDPLSL